MLGELILGRVGVYVLGELIVGRVSVGRVVCGPSCCWVRTSS